MRASTTATLLLTIAIAAGCRSYPKAAPVPERVEAVSPDNAEALRVAYRQQYPNSQLGVVAATINHDHGQFVAVGGVDVSQLAIGQLVTFFDSKQRPLTNGTVVNVLPDSVHVRVDGPALGSRRPQVGDLMIRF
jgi:hypothetical protein